MLFYTTGDPVSGPPLPRHMRPPEAQNHPRGERVRVTAQLIDARSGYHLWSDTHDRQLDDIFAIQDEIATEVEIDSAERARHMKMMADVLAEERQRYDVAKAGA